MPEPAQCFPRTKACAQFRLKPKVVLFESARATPWSIPGEVRRNNAGTMTMLKFNHIGIPTEAAFEGEIDLPHLKVTVSDHANNPFGIQWLRYWPDSPVPELVKRVAHVAFEVE